LIHDAPEYVIGDLISPFKAALALDYKSFEMKLLAAIHIRFGIPAELPAEIAKLIKRADKIAAYYEATALAGFSVEEGRRYFGQPRRAEARPGCQADAVSAAACGRQRSEVSQAFQRACSMKTMPSSLALDGLTSSQISPREAPSVPRIMSPDTIYVSPLSLVETTIEDAQVSHLVTLINGETLVPTPPSITP
jgi:hypothetical protein